MIAWAESNLHSNISESFVTYVRQILLVNYLTANSYDVKMFQEHIKKPSHFYSEFSTKYSDR